MSLHLVYANRLSIYRILFLNFVYLPIQCNRWLCFNHKHTLIWYYFWCICYQGTSLHCTRWMCENSRWRLVSCYLLEGWTDVCSLWMLSMPRYMIGDKELMVLPCHIAGQGRSAGCCQEGCWSWRLVHAGESCNFLFGKAAVGSSYKV
jgi:hypothetical protein